MHKLSHTITWKLLEINTIKWTFLTFFSKVSEMLKLMRHVQTSVVSFITSLHGLFVPSANWWVMLSQSVYSNWNSCTFWRNKGLWVFLVMFRKNYTQMRPYYHQHIYDIFLFNIINNLCINLIFSQSPWLRLYSRSLRSRGEPPPEG